MNRIDTRFDAPMDARIAPSGGARGVGSAVAFDGRRVGAEEAFVARVRGALNESAMALRADTVARLELARKTALRAQKPGGARLAPAAGLVLAGSGGRDTTPRLGFGRASAVVSAIVLVAACLAGLYQFEQDRRIDDLADVDAAVLNDDLPISAYADHGFNAYLKQNP